MNILKLLSGASYSKLINNANVIFFYLDKNGKVIICNKKIEKIIAKQERDIIGKNWLSVLYKDNAANIKQQMFKAVMDDCITNKRPSNFEGAIYDVNTKERFISWSITPILANNRKLKGMLLIGNDLTQLKENEASLKNIDETLKNILASIKEYALYAINLNGNITYYGMGSEIVFGWQKNEIIFKHISILHSQDYLKNKLSVILEEVKKKGCCELEIDLTRKTGEKFPVNLTVSQFLDAEGRLVGYIFIAKDITERKALEYQIFHAERLAAIGQLAAGIAHEINNPLFVISGRIEMLVDGHGIDKSFKDELTIMGAQVERIRKLADNLLSFSRQSPLKLVAININDTIESVLPFLAFYKLPSAKIEIEKSLENNLPAVNGDLSQLQEVFINLFINAYQAMPDGGRLAIKTKNYGGQFVEISISDTGCGIPEQNIKSMFKPFFSTKKEGTGLGLSICYNIIKKHNGTVELKSEINKGTTFVIRLPFAKLA